MRWLPNVRHPAVAMLMTARACRGRLCTRYPVAVWTQGESQPAAVSKRAPAVVLLVGAPGVGKSTFARALRERTHLPVVESDNVRRKLFEAPSYSKSESRRVFEMVHDATEDRLARGGGVIVDATNLIEADRAIFYGIAEARGARLIVVQLTAPDAVVRKRLAARSAESSGLQAGVEVFERMRRIRQPISRPHFIVDTTRGIEAAVEAVTREIEA